MTDTEPENTLGLSNGLVHLPAFMEGAFGMPRSRARGLIATGKLRVAGRPYMHFYRHHPPPDSVRAVVDP